MVKEILSQAERYFVLSSEQVDSIDVVGPSGATYSVLTDTEQEYFEEISERYLTDNKVSNITDLQDLDRVIMMEMLCYRWNLWLLTEHDYWGDQIDPELVKKSVIETSRELRLLKKSMGIDKSSRDRDKTESVAAYIENLRQRAREFGIHRNEQAAKAIELWQELKALIIAHDNALPDERKELGLEVSDIMEWIHQVSVEFDKIDAEFRESSQKYWIQTL